MSNLNILIVEGNLKEENQNFSEVGIQTHTESLKDSLKHFTNNLNFDVVNPSSDENLNLVSEKLSNYDGLIWGGSSLNIYNDTPEIKRQIEFMKECQKKVKNILDNSKPKFLLQDTSSSINVPSEFKGELAWAIVYLLSSIADK